MEERNDGGRTRGGAAAVALALGVAAVLASWIPFAGVALGAAAIVLALRARRRGDGDPAALRARTRRTLGVAGYGVLLGLGFTVAFRACTPSEETAEERQLREEFFRSFEPPTSP